MIKRINLLFILILIFSTVVTAQNKKEVIYLSWDQVVDLSLSDNLSLRSKMLDYDSQNLEYWKSLTTFLPTLDYRGLATKNVELPVFVFQGQQFKVGTNYTFQHTLNLNLPLFTGGSRWFNMSAQRNLRKSLSEELKGKEEETVLGGLQSYYNIILAKSLEQTSQEAVDVALRNLDQVKNQYDAGTATELDLQRAKAQYFSTLPKLESAKSSLILAKQQLKSFLDISLADSLVVNDSLSQKIFLTDFIDFKLDDFKELANQNREDLKSFQYKLEATEETEKLALASFSPIVSVTASVDHQAPMDNAKVMWSDYIRSKSVTLSVNWPLFQGGKRVLEYQQAKIRTDQTKIAFRQVKDGAELDVEQNYYKYKEAIKNLKSLEQALEQAKESMRIANLLYEQGMSTQLDVLNAQLLYIQSKTQYLEGIYNYNFTQLSLLKAVGKLDLIWQ